MIHYERIFKLGLVVLLVIGLNACKSKKAYRYTACEHLGHLSEGVLLFRLGTDSNKIEALKASGNVEKAKEVKESRGALNNRIISAFKDQFRFSDVYFFEDVDSPLLENEEYDKIKVLDVNGKSLSADELDLSKYLLATFGPIYTSQNVQESRESHKAVSGFSSSEGLAIMDRFKVQLMKPFPYGFKTDSKQDKIDLAVSRLDNALVGFQFRCNKFHYKEALLKEAPSNN